jgi:hypothetical protein
MRNALTLGLILSVALISGCGRQVALRPKAGDPPVPTAAAAKAPETAEQLMTPSSQARPQRNIDILTRSEERAPDNFDLPPGPDNGK